MKIRDLLDKLDEIVENETLSPLSLAGNNEPEDKTLPKPNMSPVPRQKKKKKKSPKKA